MLLPFRTVCFAGIQKEPQPKPSDEVVQNEIVQQELPPAQCGEGLAQPRISWHKNLWWKTRKPALMICHSSRQLLEIGSNGGEGTGNQIAMATATCKNLWKSCILLEDMWKNHETWTYWKVARMPDVQECKRLLVTMLIKIRWKWRKQHETWLVVGPPLWKILVSWDD